MGTAILRRKDKSFVRVAWDRNADGRYTVSQSAYGADGYYQPWASSDKRDIPQEGLDRIMEDGDFHIREIF